MNHSYYLLTCQNTQSLLLICNMNGGFWIWFGLLAHPSSNLARLIATTFWILSCKFDANLRSLSYTDDPLVFNSFADHFETDKWASRWKLSLQLDYVTDYVILGFFSKMPEFLEFIIWLEVSCNLYNYWVDSGISVRFFSSSPFILSLTSQTRVLLKFLFWPTMSFFYFLVKFSIFWDIVSNGNICSNLVIASSVYYRYWNWH